MQKEKQNLYNAVFTIHNLLNYETMSKDLQFNKKTWTCHLTTKLVLISIIIKYLVL